MSNPGATVGCSVTEVPIVTDNGTLIIGTSGVKVDRLALIDRIGTLCRQGKGLTGHATCGGSHAKRGAAGITDAEPDAEGAVAVTRIVPGGIPGVVNGHDIQITVVVEVVISVGGVVVGIQRSHVDTRLEGGVSIALVEIGVTAATLYGNQVVKTVIVEIAQHHTVGVRAGISDMTGDEVAVAVTLIEVNITIAIARTGNIHITVVVYIPRIHTAAGTAGIRQQADIKP